jgi:uncharacterized damage-inducible protein DinB
LSTAAVPLTLLRLNTRLFVNCLDGVSDEQAERRIDANTNSIAFIACHLVDSRHYLAGYIGLSEPNPFTEVLRGATGIDDVGPLPDIDAMRRAWLALAPTLEACVADMAEEELRVVSPQRFPVDLPSMLGAIAFLVQHESYHIGQMALLRKFVGLPAMKYS